MTETIIKTIFFKNLNSAPEDRYVGKPSFLGQKYTLENDSLVVVQIIESPGNQVIVLDFLG